MASFLVDCPKCRTTLQLPPGAQKIQCVVCSTVISIAPAKSAQPSAGGYPGPGPSGSFAPPPPYVGGPAPFPPSGSYQLPPPPSGGYQPPPGNYGVGPPGGAFVRPEIPASSLPPPNPNQYTPSMPSFHGKKRAVVCGISYLNQRYHLKGCINDAQCMKFLLTSKLGFREEQVLMLTEEDRDPLRIPTRYNIMSALYWLIQGQQAGDSLVFHYSGHGGQQRNRLGEEVDGFDETICPVDFERNGQIVDDELNRALVNPLLPGVRLHAVVDACHSGTILDLPFLAQINQYNQVAWEDQRMGRTYKGTAGGEAISFSGCEDAQTSADTAAFSGTVSTGAMTYSFIQAIERNQAQTYGALLAAMRQAIRDANASLGAGGGIPVLAGGGLLGSLLGSVFGAGSGGGLTQIPQLSSDRMFDLNRPFSI